MDDRNRRLVLIRHGQTDSNDAGRFLGRSDPALNARGRLQAASLQPLVDSYDPTSIISSPLRRARSTADIACRHSRPGTVDDRLKELDFGDWEGLTQDEAQQHDPESFHKFDVGRIGRFPGGDDIAEVADRIHQAVEEQANDRILFVTHATWIRVAVTSLLNMDFTRYRSLLGRPENGSWTELVFTHSSWKLNQYNHFAPAD